MSRSSANFVLDWNTVKRTKAHSFLPTSQCIMKYHHLGLFSKISACNIWNTCVHYHGPPLSVLIPPKPNEFSKNFYKQQHSNLVDLRFRKWTLG